MSRSSVHLNFLLVAAVPISVTCFACRAHENGIVLIAAAVLAITCLIVGFSHHTEMLQFRWVFFFLYAAYSAVAVLTALIQSSAERAMVQFVAFSALGSSPLWIPGVLRMAVAYSGRLWKPKEAGVLEALSLVTTLAPREIDALRDAIRFPIGNTRRLTSLVNGDIPVRALVSIVDTMHQLAAATQVRGFRVQHYRPELRLSILERVSYGTVAGILLCLTWIL